MTRYVAFLRGINLGNRRLKMDELRRHFEGLEVENPATYLASGNVIFDHDGRGDGDLERRIEDHLADALGYEVDTFLRPMGSLGDVVRRAEAERASWVADPDAGDDETAAGSRTVKSRAGRSQAVKPHVIFLREPVDSAIEDGLAGLETPDDSFRVLGGERGREVVWLRRGRTSDSDVEPRHLDEAFSGRTRTMRTLNTVRRIVDKFGP